MSDVETKDKRPVWICYDKEELGDKAAEFFAKQVNAIVAEKGSCSVALSGGSTPKAMYKSLLKDEYASIIPWNKILFFVSDERCVPHESEESNYGNADRALLSPMKISSAQLHPTQGQDKDPDTAASSYEIEIRRLVPAGKNGLPSFDLIFLGMGPDGHTASLFPGSAALSEKKRLVVKNHVAKVNADRITFTFPLINSAQQVVFLVTGADKAEILVDVFRHANMYPVEHVNLDEGTITWFVDRAAVADDYPDPA